MANVLGELFKDIADAIREKSGDTATMKPIDFPANIKAIEAGGGGESEDDRVKYVTFMDGTNSTIVPAQQRLFTDSTNSNGTIFSNVAITDIGMGMVHLLNSEKCLVYFEGAYHELTRKAADTGAYWGNMSIALKGADTGEDFLVFFEEDKSYLAVWTKETLVDTMTTTHTMGVYIESRVLIKYPVISGDTVRDPVTMGYIETPTKDATNTTVYTFSGWSLVNGLGANASALKNVTEDRVVYVAFAESKRLYTVRFYDGETLVQTLKVGYGETAKPSYSKPGYVLVGWTPTNENITQDTDCYGEWEESYKLESLSWSDISTLAQNGNASKFELGDTKTITYEGSTHTVTLVGINKDKRTETGTPIGLTFRFDFLCNYEGTIDTTDGSTIGAEGGYLNNTSPKLNSTMLNKLPSDLKSVIKGTYKRFQTNSGTSGKTVKLFAPSSYELGKSARIDDQEIYYDYLVNYPSRLKLTKSDGTAAAYATRTKSSGYNMAVKNDGTVGLVTYNNHYWNVFFCV